MPMALTVSGNWMAALFRSQLEVYSLPDLQRRKTIWHGCRYIRADRNGRLYFGCWRRVDVLELSETGEITATRTLTLGGRLRSYPLVAAGARRGLIWVHDKFYFRYNSTIPWLIDIDTIYLCDVDTDTVIQTLHRREESSYRGMYWGMVGLDTGELMLTTCYEGSYNCVLQLYQPDLATPPQNLTITGHVLTAYGNHLLVLEEPSNTILILNGRGKLMHTVDDLNGKHAGIWMKIQDVAVWQNNLVILSSNGGVMILRIG